MSKSDYSAKNIKLLDGIAHIRRRSSMYVGSTDKDGVLHILKEALDNSIDEATNGHAKNIWVWIEDDCMSAAVTDDGRGIPVEKHSQTNESTLTTVLTKLQAGGKFDDKSYSTAAGLHGVGIKATNALSSELVATVWRDKKCYTQTFECGKAQGKVKPEKSRRKELKHGTEIWFTPDPDIFDTGKNPMFDAKDIRQRLSSIAHLCPGIKFHFSHKDKEVTYESEDGLGGFLRQKAKRDKCKLQHEPIVFDSKTVQFAIAWAEWDDESWTEMFGFCNVSPTPEGGTHVNGLKKAIVKAVNEVKSKASVKSDDICDNMYAIISVKVKEPKFKGQTKGVLNNPEVETEVYKAAYAHLSEYFTKGKGRKIARAVIERAVQLGKVREQNKKLRQAVNSATVSKNDKGILPGKLAMCDIHTLPEKRELFVVEGDSAGGTAKGARNTKYQMVLPLRGKILNAQRATLSKLLENKEIQALIQSIGIKIDVHNQENNDLSKLRLGKILLLMDADYDGLHIASLALTFLVNYAWQLIEQGMVYVVRSPLFIATSRDGKNRWFGDTVAEIEKLSGKSATQINVSRLKGHGECVKSTSQLLTESGLVKIGSLVNEPEEKGWSKVKGVFVPSYTSNSTSVEKVFNKPEAKVSKIKTRFGFSLYPTKDHQLMVMRNGRPTWVEVRNIEEGDFVALDRRGLWPSKVTELQKCEIPKRVGSSGGVERKYKTPSKVTPELARLLGYMIGDGSLGRKGVIIHFGVKHEAAKDAKRIVQHLFPGLPCSVKPYRTDRGTLCKSTKFMSKFVMTFLRKSCGLRLATAYTKTVPSIILKSPKHIQAEFLRGYFECDGWTEALNKVVGIYTASKSLGEQIRLMLLNFGIIAKGEFASNLINPFTGQYTSSGIKLCIEGEDVNRFMSSIGFFSNQKVGGRLDLKRSTNTNVDVIPGLKDAVISIKERHRSGERGSKFYLVNGKKVAINFGYFSIAKNFTYTEFDHLYPTLRSSVGIFDKDLVEAMDWIHEKRPFWELVTSITLDVGTARVCDVRIPDGESYTANGFIVHNCSASELREYAMDKSTRKLYKVLLKEKCHTRIESIMGDDSSSRKVLLGITEPEAA